MILKLLGILVIVAFIFILIPENGLSSKPDEYNNAYCHEQEHLALWQKIIENNQGNDNVQALHALWMGLCAKVEQRQLTVARANEIFENARTAVVNTFLKNNKSVF